MRRLTFDDLFLGLKDLVTTRRADLDASAIGAAYSPQLVARAAQFEELTVRNPARVNVTELAHADDDHDGFGHGIWLYTEAILVAPGVSENVRRSALRIREAFIPGRSVLTDSYAEEAARAKRNQPKVAELENDLKNLPVPDGKTLLDWVNGFLDAGMTLDKLLSDRSTVEAAHDGTLVTTLRVSTIGLLRRFRESLRDEVAANASLPRDLEARVFAYIDELADRRGKIQNKK
jgi:hypothetical protein